MAISNITAQQFQKHREALAEAVRFNESSFGPQCQNAMHGEQTSRGQQFAQGSTLPQPVQISEVVGELKELQSQLERISQAIACAHDKLAVVRTCPLTGPPDQAPVPDVPHSLLGETIRELRKRAANIAEYAEMLIQNLAI